MIALLARSFLAFALFLSVAGAATSLDTVTIEKKDNANEGGTPGKFSVIRTGSTGPLTVSLQLDEFGAAPIDGVQISGVATFTPTPLTGILLSSTGDKDFGLALSDTTIAKGGTIDLSGLATSRIFTISFNNGQSEVEILVNAYDDGVKEGRENVKVRLFRNDGVYLLGATEVATVFINDDDIVVTVGMIDETASESFSDPSPEGNFQILTNDILFNKTLDFTLSGSTSSAAIRGVDYAPAAMVMHQPTSGELAAVTLNAAAKNYSFTPDNGSLIPVSSLEGSGWYVNVPPSVSFTPLVDANRVSFIDHLRITASDKNFPTGRRISLSNILPSSLPSGRSASGFGLVNDQGELVSVSLLDAGVYAKSDLTTPGTVTITYGGGTATAVIEYVTPSGSRASGVAVLNGIVTRVDVPAGQGGTNYTSEPSVSFINAPGDTTGTGAKATAHVTGLTVEYIIITDAGHGYTQVPQVVISGSGSGAVAFATIEGPVRRVDVTNAGLGYDAAPSFSFTRIADPKLPKVAAATPDATASDFSISFNPRVHNPDFFTRRSSGVDNRFKINWTAKIDPANPSATTYNKKNQSKLSAITGVGSPFNPLTVGDWISIGADSTPYIITQKALASTVSNYYVFDVTPNLKSDVSDDTVVTNTPAINGDSIQYGLPSYGTVGYYAVQVGITPIDDTLLEGAEDVSLFVKTNPDYLNTDPQIQSMIIADDDVKVKIELVNNGSEPNLAGKARVTLVGVDGKPVTLAKDAKINYRISGNATPGAGSPADPLNSDYIISELRDIVAPVVSGGKVLVQASAAGYVTIDKNTSSKDILINVLNDTITEGTEFLTVTLQSDASIQTIGSSGSGSEASATINIADNLGTVSLGYTEDGTENPTKPTTGFIRFIVDGNKGVDPANVGINFSMSGTATFQSDYNLAGLLFSIASDGTTGSATLRAQEPLWVSAVDPTDPTKVTVKSALGTALVVNYLSAEGNDNDTRIVIGGSTYKVVNGGGTSSKTGVVTGGFISNTGTMLTLDKAVDVLVTSSYSLTATSTATSSSIQLLSSQSLTIPAKSGLVINGRIYIVRDETGLVAGTSKSVILAQQLVEDVNATMPVALALRPAVGLRIQTSDDTVVEGTESVIAKLESGSGYSISGVSSTATAYIIDDEPTISITRKQDGAEVPNGTVQVPAILEFSYPGVPAGIPLPRAVTVLYKLEAESTATAGTDYELPSVLSVDIPANSLSVTLPITIKDDLLVEPVETIAFSLVSSATYAKSTQSKATVSITDDAPVISVVASALTAAEGGSDGSFVFSYAGAALTRPVNVSFTLTGTATQVNDYSIPTGYSSVDIPSGSTSVIIAVNIVDDNSIESNESINLTLLDGATSGYKVGTAAAASITIKDNDLPTISIKSAGDATKPSANGKFTISVIPTLTSAITVNLGSFIDPSVLLNAVEGTDYATLSTTYTNYTIPANMPSETFNLVVLPDNTVNEADKSAVIQIKPGPGYLINSDPAKAKATVVIKDGNPVQVNLSSPADVTKGSSVQPVVTLSQFVNQDITIALTVTGTARPGLDYTAFPSLVTIPKGQTSVKLTLTPTADGIYSSDKSVIMTLGAGPLYTLQTASATTIIHSAPTDAPPNGSLVGSSGGNGGCGAGSGVALMGLTAGFLALRRRRSIR